MPSPVLKRSVALGGRKTSVSLENEFWAGLKEIAAARRTSVTDLIAAVDRDRRQGNLSSCLRLIVLEDAKRRACLSPRPRKVLVVDDEPMALEVAAGMLEDLGCEVLTATSGNEALHRLDGVSILISDINMPGLTGHELAERARRMHPGLQVVLMSGQHREGYGLPLLSKPLREADLARVLEQTVPADAANPRS
jgi:two-component system, cell cycle response regulator CpdR